MSSKWYGSLQNRLEENQQFCSEITVGMGVTEYHWSDREAYEVVEVTDQKHVKIRRLDHKLIGGAYSNQWELTSNKANPTYDLVKRGKYWYYTSTLTKAELEQITDKEKRLRLAVAGFDFDKVMEKGKQTKLSKANVSFGKADYYFDYEF